MNKHKILVVDDEEEICDIYQFYLKEFNVTSAKNGQEALDLLKSQSFDVVVSDINMPVMSGLKLLEETRKLGLLTAFIMVSAFGDKDKIREAWKLGAYDFLEKPTNKETLNALVKRALDFGPQFMQTHPALAAKNIRNLSLKLSDETWKKLDAKAKASDVLLGTLIENILEDQNQ